METPIQDERERTQEAQEVYAGEEITAEEIKEEIRNIFKGE